ncbi:hypothetical protein [Roseibium sp. RKSG952]|uniref:secretion/conjugation apparatus DotM-related subunit n=1 Tax=Roseibium sp. RKSG952 TaxID=2529384 RepID=UPI0012BCC563|nr:hypothetical protein [Roseibium sp. RKSG952]MTH95719.1 hypothetical protein [Roseibium sp. RKSG952]
MAYGNDGKDTGANSEMLYALIAALVIGGAWLLWTYARPVVVYPAFAMDWISIKVIELIKGLGSSGIETLEYVESVFDGRNHASTDVNWTTFSEVRSRVGMQTRFVFAAVILGLSALIFMKMKGDGYKRTFSLAGGKGKPPSFAKYQAGQWKVAAVSANFEPDGRDKSIEPALTPLEWMKENGVRFEEGELDEDAAREAFAKQLGKPWHSMERADLPVRTVLTLCILHLTRNKAALNERSAIAQAWASGADGTKACQELVARYEKDEKLSRVIKKLAEKHAHQNTVVISVLTQSRNVAGVLASADFLWVKKVDRSLWYTINNVGRRRYHVEGAGSICHYFGEHIGKRPILEPYLNQAVDGLDGYLDEQGILSLTEFFDDEEMREMADF